jgi:N-sulfoglucosamine sulfohydrolase
LASDPTQTARLIEMRAELESWMRTQGDRQKVYDEPRRLSDPTSYGPGALPDIPPPKKKDKA